MLEKNCIICIFQIHFNKVVQTIMKNHAINLTLFKLSGFYQIVDKNTSKVFGYNVYQLLHVLLSTISATITVIGISGLFYQVDGSREYDLKLYMRLFSSIIFVLLGYFITYTVITNANNIQNLFDIAHESFSKSEHCKQLFYKMEIFGKNFTTYYLLYVLLFFMTALAYILLPIFWNDNGELIEITQSNDNFLMVNVLNYMYPITMNIYNKFYMTIYIMESIVCAYSFYVVFTFDILVITLLNIISTQYEIILSAYGILELRDEEQNGKLLIQIMYAYIFIYLFIV